MTASAVNPLRVSVVTALEATSAGTKVYHEGDVPRDVSLPYIVLGTATEDEGEFIQQPGQDGTIQVKCWAEDSWAAQELYAEAKTVLHEVMLAVSGHRLIRGRLSRLTDFAEPNPEVGGHVVIGLYRSQTLEA